MSKSFVKKKSLKVMIVIDSFKIKLLKLHISFLESKIIIIMKKKKKTLSFALLISNSHSLILDRWTPTYPYKTQHDWSV